MASGQDRLNAGNNPILRILIIYLIRRVRERRRERQLTRGQRPVHDPPDSGLPGASGGGPVRRARRAHRAVLSAAGIEPTAFCPEQARCQYPAGLSRPSARGRRGCTAYVPHGSGQPSGAVIPSLPTAKSVSSGKTPGQKSLQKSCTQKELTTVNRAAIEPWPSWRPATAAPSQRPSVDVGS